MRRAGDGEWTRGMSEESKEGERQEGGESGEGVRYIGGEGIQGAKFGKGRAGKTQEG